MTTAERVADEALKRAAVDGERRELVRLLRGLYLVLGLVGLLSAIGGALEMTDNLTAGAVILGAGLSTLWMAAIAGAVRVGLLTQALPPRDS